MAVKPRKQAIWADFAIWQFGHSGLKPQKSRNDVGKLFAAIIFKIPGAWIVTLYVNSGTVYIFWVLVILYIFLAVICECFTLETEYPFVIIWAEARRTMYIWKDTFSMKTIINEK